MAVNEYITRRGSGTSVGGPIRLENSYSNVDYWYGPYDSLEDACEATSILRVAHPGHPAVNPKDVLGLTVGVIENGKIVEYWWNTDDISGLPVKKE